MRPVDPQSDATPIPQRVPEPYLRAEIAALRAEQRLLTAQLNDLRDQVQRSQPVVHVGGDDRVDFVLNLEKALEQNVPIGHTGGSL